MSITHAEKRAWILKIRDVKESDKGWYMCQINTDPMKSQVGYLDVVVPPDILDYPTSADMVVREGSNVTLKCAATGSPTPTITWRREGGIPIQLPDGQQVVSVNGSILSIARVNRSNMGAYLCIASNGIPPTVSKRVMVIVHFPPMIWIQNQLVGAAVGQTIKLECQSEAFPKSINYWMRNDTIIVPGENFVPEIYENGYKVVMKLTIKHVDMSSFGSYKCVSKNSLGDTDGAIKLYQIPHTTAMTTVAATRPLDTFTSVHKIGNHKGKNFHHKSSVDVLTMSTNNVLIGATSSLWNSQDEIRDKHPDSNNRSERPSNTSNIQHKANDLSNNEKSHTSSSSSSSSVLLPIPSSSSSSFFILLFSLISSLKLFSITLKFKEHKII